MPEPWLAERLTQTWRVNARGQNVTNHFVILKRKVPVETWNSVQAAMSNLVFSADEKTLPRKERQFFSDLRKKAVFSRDEQIRSYPGQALASHVLGYATAQEKEIDGVWASELVGRDGVELVLNGKLAGVRGWRISERDRQRQELVILREQDVEPRDGCNVILTIDSMVQHMLETALAEAFEKHQPNNISGFVVRPRTGEIVAMATLPNYDPNKFGSARPEAMRNRAIADLAEPGSTFKIVVVSGALDDRVVKLMDAFDCEHGRFHYAAVFCMITNPMECSVSSRLSRSPRT